MSQAAAKHQQAALFASEDSDGDMSADENVLHFEFPGADLQFRVDRSRRQISGLVLPWNQTAYSGGFPWRFQRGSIEFPGKLDRVKLLRDHDLRRVVGKALSFEDHPDGLHGTFYVIRGPTGDEVLAAAEDGVLDGFSVGPNMSSDGWTRDPNDSTVRLVHHGRLVETTITAFPAFDDARVASVVASKGAQMSEKDNKSPGSDDGQATLLNDQGSAMERFEQELDQRFEAVTAKLAESFEGVTRRLAETHEKIVTDALAASYGRLESPAAVADAEFSKARLKVVSEPPTYRFDSDPRGHSMVRDFWRANTERDHDAIERLRRFQGQQQDMVKLLQRMPPAARQMFDVTSSNASQVIPPGYRPDLFVNELRKGRPLVAQMSRGTITDATPFTVPRFVSATTATADHVEGTNPTEGSMVLDAVTVSPGAVSGRFDLTREIVDASNPAIDAIALATMRESYNRQTEQKAYAQLNIDANVGQFTNVTVAQRDASDSVVIGFVRALLADYPFVRFAAPTGAVIGQGVTRNFANAKDTTNRPLLPSVGAQNTAGLGNAVDQGWFVDGLPFVPAWAVTQAVTDEIALILNSADVWAWESPLLTFRFEEKQGPAIIELALFAYFATKVLRPAGIFSLRQVA